MTGNEIMIELPHARVAAKVWGKRGGEPVLALHGWLDNAGSFDLLAPLLSDVELLAIDFIGHGKSSHRSADGWYHFVDYVSDVLAVLDRLSWSSATLLGHSLGGAIASLLAAAVPDRVRQLWLIEALGPLSGSVEDAVVTLQKAMTERENLYEKPLRIFKDAEQAIALRQQVNHLSYPAAKVLVERGLREIDDGFIWATDRRLMLTSPARLSEEQVLAYLKGIRCPAVLVLSDPPMPFVSEAHWQARFAAVQQLRKKSIPGPHHLHLEKPFEVAQAIEAFRREGR